MNREECTCSSWLITMPPMDHVSCLALSSTVWLLAGPLVSHTTCYDETLYCMCSKWLCSMTFLSLPPNLHAGADRICDAVEDITGHRPWAFYKLCWLYFTPLICTVSSKSPNPIHGEVCVSHSGCLNDVFFLQGLLHMFIHKLPGSDIQQGLCVPRLCVFSGLGYGLIVGGGSTYIRHREALPDQGNPQTGKKNNTSWTEFTDSLD